MTHSRISFAVFIFIGLLMTGCNSPEVLDDLGDRSWKLVDQDSAAVTFPDDFKGQILVVGYIFTKCPGVCPAITANMKRISGRITEEQNVHFIGITFDPVRDRPSVLKAYMNKFDLNETRFTFLTGDSSTVTPLLDRVEIRTERHPDPAIGYRFNHTNQINLIDQQGRIRMEYGGSMVPAEHVIEDINKLK